MADQVSRLGRRMQGACALLVADSCQTMGVTQFPDNSVGRWICIAAVFVWLYLCYRAWRREMAP